VATEQTVGLEAEAYDIDLGTMPDELISWSSSRDGVLGTGAQLSVATLSVGVHTITVTVTDGAGGTAADSVQVTVVADLPPPSPSSPLFLPLLLR
jgi:hypothetical protein